MVATVSAAFAPFPIFEDVIIRARSSILEEAKSLVAGGVRELVLIGQDTGIWGEDFDQTVEGPHTLAELLIELAEAVRPEPVWIRVPIFSPKV